MNFSVRILVMSATLLAVVPLRSQTPAPTTGPPPQSIAPPRVFLNKSPRAVRYQLNRLSNDRLLAVERNTGDGKYAPVFTAILTRAGMSPQHRQDALWALVELNQSDPAEELLTVLDGLDPTDRQQRQTSRQLLEILLTRPADELLGKTNRLQTATNSESALMRPTGYAGLIVAGDAQAAWERASRGEQAQLDWLTAVRWLPTAFRKTGLRDQVVNLLNGTQPKSVRRAAIDTLTTFSTGMEETFQLIAPLVADDDFRLAAVRGLLRIPQQHRDPRQATDLVDLLVGTAEETAVEARTEDTFIDALELTEQLLALLPAEAARGYRQRLREITVRVIRIRTVNEEMRYDTPYFAVEAGRPVQIVLRNDDLMPHNLVVTVPGALQEVAELGLAAGPKGGYQGQEYVPETEKVLHATGLVPPDQQERLTFTTPVEPGEYPYVCTFPRHWMRMYGVMIVVPDLDKWLANPVKPQDPVGSNRDFVRNWTVDDLKDELEVGLRGRSLAIGQRIFTEASCSQCHKIGCQGGAVGPELTDVFRRWKGDRFAVLREILEPSHRVDPKYAVRLIITDDGQTVSGIVMAEDKTRLSVFDNPEAKEPTIIKRSEISEMVKTSTSMMPKALLDRFTKDEIFELLAYLESAESLPR